MTDRRFALLVLVASALGPFYALLGGASAMALPLALSLAIAAVGLYAWFRPLKGVAAMTPYALLYLILPVFYSHTGPLIRMIGRERRDDLLEAGDRFLFGWLFPQGQISLWLDQSTWLGPQVLLGRIVTEFLQLMYFSYYFWGFGLLFYLLIRAGVSSVTSPSAPQTRDYEAQLRAFICAWIGTFMVNFLGYLLVPAIGPQFTMVDRYAHEVTGLWLTPMLRGTIHSAQGTVEDCFPSGHTALSWIAGLYAIRLTPKFGKFALAAAAPITLATLFLRYHYIVDLLAAIPMIGMALVWGGWAKLKK